MITGKRMSSAPQRLASFLIAVLLVTSSSFVACRPQQEKEDMSYDLGGKNTTQAELTQSSEFVFSPEQHYVNDDEVNAMLEIRTRDWRTPPFDTEERLWGTTLKDTRWRRVKQAVKKFFRIDTEKRPWNVTKEPHRKWVFRHLRTLHNFVRYTVLNQPTPNATNAVEVTEDSLEFWRAHGTNWKYLNQLHFEIMNSTNARGHWFYRTIMAAYGVNLEDVSTTTPLYFDINRMTHFSRHITLPTTTPLAEYEDVPSAQISSDIRALITLRPAFHKAIDKFLNKLDIPTIPRICEKGLQATCFPEAPIYKRIRNKLISFYYITTNDPESPLDSHEKYRNNKLQKWLVKEEKRMLESVSKEIGAYVPDFGPKFNSFYTWINGLSTTTSRLDKLQLNEEKVETKNSTGTTIYLPPHVQRAFSEGRMFNSSIFEKFIVAHCANKSINWPTDPRTHRTEIAYIELTETTTLPTTEFTGTTPTWYVVPKDLEQRILSENFTLNREKIDAMLDHAQNYMRNLSIFKIEANWQKASQLMWENQFSTTPIDPTYDENFVDRAGHMGNYREGDYDSEENGTARQDSMHEYQDRFNEALSATLPTSTGRYQDYVDKLMREYTPDEESVTERSEEDHSQMRHL